jgi:type IV pilus assembly protein PilE
MERERGFTLIELLVVVAIVAILAAVAVPAYSGQMRKSRRTEAKQVLTDYALRQEKWRATHATYGSLADINGAATTTSGNYTIGAITFAPATGSCPGTTTAIGSANSFVITATATGSQASDNACDTLVITNMCGTVTKSSTPAGGTCW